HRSRREPFGIPLKRDCSLRPASRSRGPGPIPRHPAVVSTRPAFAGSWFAVTPKYIWLGGTQWLQWNWWSYQASPHSKPAIKAAFGLNRLRFLNLAVRFVARQRPSQTLCLPAFIPP